GPGVRGHASESDLIDQSPGRFPLCFCQRSLWTSAGPNVRYRLVQPVDLAACLYRSGPVEIVILQQSTIGLHRFVSYLLGKDVRVEERPSRRQLLHRLCPLTDELEPFPARFGVWGIGT